PGLPPAADIIVARALAKSPEARYQSVEAFLHDLESHLLCSRDRGEATEQMIMQAAPSSTTRLPRRTEPAAPARAARPLSLLPWMIVSIAVAFVIILGWLVFNL
ncbi:MAG: hypothetical protein CUN49_18680, partial [Candidatus Thermofonsia Clade 1 bacterium]